MRTSAWTLPALAIVLFLVAVAWPLMASIEVIANQSPSAVEGTHTTQLLIVSTSWGATVAVGAMLLGWLPGRWLGSALSRRRFTPLAVLLLIPICLPAYTIFFAWWQAWPAGSWLYQWAVEHRQVPLVRQGTLLMGFLCWSWPIVAWCVAGAVAVTPAQRDELLRIDGVGVVRRWLDRLRTDGRALAVGGLVVFLATFNNTTSFDLAEIFTFGNELRAIEALGANNRDVLTAAMPATVMTACGAALIWFMLAGRRPEPALRTSPMNGWAAGFTGLLWLGSVAVPLALLARNLRTSAGGRTFSQQLDEFRLFYTQGLLNTIGIAVVCAALCVIVAIALAWMWQDRRAWVRALAHVQAVGWIITAAVPGTMVAVALRAAYNREPLADFVYNQPIVLVLGHMARFAFLGALLGRWMAMNEARSFQDLRAIDGANGAWGLVRATWPRLVAVSAATFSIVLVLSLSEIPVTAAVRPAGFDAITTSILNDMHFQRPQTVMIATGIFLALATVAATATCVGWGVLRRFGAPASSRAAALLVAASVMLVGCGGLDADNVPPLRTEMIFGSPGQGLGQFSYPRAIAMDKQAGYVYIVDKTARIQRYGLDGKPQLAWQMPQWELGKPTGLTVSDDGTVFVADTHYFRVMAFDSEGNELMRFGRFGQGPGEFVYTTGVAIGPEGRIYVSEAGGNDRIQVFDSRGGYLFQFGSYGGGPDQFNRPQSLAFNHDKTELYIADACNHRIVVTDPQGNVLRHLGGPGSAPGLMSYPYDVNVLPDGSLMVCEFHNCRLQRLSPEGVSLGLYGRLGRRDGELQFPWGVVGDEQRLFVLDSGNNRVQVIRTP